MAIHYHESQLEIMDYNRVIKTLNGMSTADFMQKISASYDISPVPEGEDPRPKEKFSQSMYIEKQWFRMKVKPECIDNSSPTKILET
mmetsp:Transcript_34140/g.25214  ORF Transcript_34140/g.25214 Transcript_34140/m.25214 type:complete len:87 (-) Transcript_34140:320-580(-)